MDDLLVDEAFDTLERADEHLSPLMGGSPPGTTILEIYPDARSFIAASSRALPPTTTSPSSGK